MTTYPARYRLRAVSELSQIQEKWGVSPSIVHPGEIGNILLERISLPASPYQEYPIPYCYGMRHIAGRKRLNVMGQLKKGVRYDKKTYESLYDVPDKVIEAVRNEIEHDLRPLLLDVNPITSRPPITPRRVFSAQIIEDDPFRPKIPGPPSMLQNWTVLGSVHENMKFWFRTLFWLKGLLALMDQSIAKSHEDLFVLDSGPLNVGEGESQRPYWRMREIIPTDEAMDLSICNLDPRFFGPGYIPVLAGLPSNEDIANIRAFKSSHRREKLKYMQHLFFLYDIIDEELIPQVEEKLEGLVNRELQWLQKNNQQPATPYYVDYDDLEYVDSGIAVQNLAERLESSNWDTVSEAIYDLRALAKYHRETLQELLGTIIPLIIAKVVKGRPVVVKSAIMACGDLLLVYPPDSISTFINPMMDSLLLKVIGVHRFISEEAILVLTSMARRLHIRDDILLSKVIPLLHERSLFVRGKAYQFLALCLPVCVAERNEFIVQYAILSKAHLQF